MALYFGVVKRVSKVLRYDEKNGYYKERKHFFNFLFFSSRLYGWLKEGVLKGKEAYGVVIRYFFTKRFHQILRIFN